MACAWHSARLPVAGSAVTAGGYVVQLVDDPNHAATLRLEWARRAEWDDWSRHSEGCYVLRTNVTDWPPDELWKTYIQLTEAEAAFRIHKTELSLRPIWHQRADRVQAHILVCFLAYVLWKTLAQWQKRAGLGNSPRTLLDQIGSIQSADIILPIAATPEREFAPPLRRASRSLASHPPRSPRPPPSRSPPPPGAQRTNVVPTAGPKRP